MYLSNNFDDNFFYNNIVKTNELCSKLLLLGNLISPGLALFTYFGVFSVSYEFCAKVSILCLLFTLVQFISQNFMKNQYYVMYQGLTLTTIYICILGTNRYVGVYISYAVVPFLSCLYFYKKATVYACSVSYVTMLLSLWGKAQTTYLRTQMSCPMEWWMPIAMGFTFEYFFVLFFTLSISTQFKKSIMCTDKKNKRLMNIQNNIIQAFSNSIEWSEEYSGNHISNTSKYVGLIARRLLDMGCYKDILTDDEIALYVSAVPLHDVGKNKIPKSIIDKPGRYTEEEYEVMKTHAELGYDIITKELSDFNDDQFITVACNMAKYHHEHWDGKGYPEGVRGTEIPLCARIMAAADVLDAILSKRCYKEAGDINSAIDYFADTKGTQFDPNISDAVITLRKDILKVIKQ